MIVFRHEKKGTHRKHDLGTVKKKCLIGVFGPQIDIVSCKNSIGMKYRDNVYNKDRIMSKLKILINYI